MAYDIVAYNLLYLCVAGVTLVIGILTVIYWHYAKGKSQTYEEPTKCVAAGSDLETSKEISNLEPARQEPDFPPSGACPVNQQAIGMNYCIHVNLWLILPGYLLACTTIILV